MSEREPVEKYFSLFHGQKQNYSEMKPCKPAIDCLISDGTLIGQLTLDQDMVVYKSDTKFQEPIDLDVR